MKLPKMKFWSTDTLALIHMVLSSKRYCKYFWMEILKCTVLITCYALFWILCSSYSTIMKSHCCVQNRVKTSRKSNKKVRFSVNLIRLCHMNWNNLLQQLYLCNVGSGSMEKKLRIRLLNPMLCLFLFFSN